MLQSRQPVTVSQRDKIDASRRTYQVVELNGRYAVVDTRDDLHGDGGGVDMVGVEPVTQSRHSCRDLVELHAFLASIWVAVSLALVQQWSGR